MKKLLASLVILFLAAGTGLTAPAGKPAPSEKAAPAAKAAPADTAERWLHVRVEDGHEDGGEGETVNVNVPLSLAEKVLPAIQVEKFQKGKVRLDDGDMKDVDIRAILQAVRDAKDGVFVTVEGKDNVRVAKEKGNLLVKVREGNESGSRVDVQIPMAVVEALVSGDKEELDVAAAVRALAQHGDELLVTVKDKGNNVRIWIDSQNASR